MISLDLEDHCAIGKYHKVLHTVCTKYSQSEPPWFVYIKVILQWILIEHLGNPPPLSCYCFQIHWCCLSMSLVLLEIVSGSERELIMINEDLGASLLTFIKFSDTSHYCTASETPVCWACLQTELFFQSTLAVILSPVFSPYAPLTATRLLPHLVLWQCGCVWMIMLMVWQWALPDPAHVPSQSNGGKWIPD